MHIRFGLIKQLATVLIARDCIALLGVLNVGIRTDCTELRELSRLLRQAIVVKQSIL